jgi:uncharacterized protein YuzE
MKITYDENVDALYIRLLEGEFQCRTVRLSDTVALNIGPAEQLVGVEILDAKETLDLGPAPEVAIENLKARLAG